MSEPPDRQSDDSLVRAAIRGDVEAIETLWHEHRRWIAAVLLTYKPRSEDVEDLLQEVAMTLVQKIHTLREESNVRAWLRTVAMNAARAAGRSGKYRPRVGLADVEPVTDHGASLADVQQSDRASRLLDLASELSDIYREPLVLRAVHGLRTKQIAVILDVPFATVDTRIARARSMLRTKMRESESSDDAALTASSELTLTGREVKHERYA